MPEEVQAAYEALNAAQQQAMAARAAADEADQEVLTAAAMLKASLAACYPTSK